MPESSDVRVSKALLGVLVLLTMASLAGVSFLLGRESGRDNQAVAPTPIQVVVAPPPAAPPLAVAPPPPVQAVPQPSAHPAEPQAHATVTLAPPPPGPLQEPASTPHPATVQSTPVAAARPAAGPGSKAVAVYFAEVDKIGPEKMGDDPDKMANELMQGALNGDMSGMNKIIAETQQSRALLEKLHPPPPCKKFHQASLDLMEQSISMLKSVTSSITHNDPGGLQSMAAKATLMQSQAEALKDQEASIKRQYGI